jgi:hypothetical protein
VVRKLLLQLYGAVRTRGALPLGKAGVGGSDARFRPQATRGVSPDRADQANRGCRRSRRCMAGKTRFAAGVRHQYRPKSRPGLAAPCARAPVPTSEALAITWCRRPGLTEERSARPSLLQRSRPKA